MSDSAADQSDLKEEVVAYIEAEAGGVKVEDVIRDLEIPGRMLPEILHDLLVAGRIKVIDNLYYVD